MNQFKSEKEKNLNKKNRGFTLLFAVLVSTLVLAIGAAIISIALKQIIISGSARDSQFAFYAANTAAECARYWNSVENTEDGFEMFPFDYQNATTSNDTLSCLGVTDIKNDANLWEDITIDEDNNVVYQFRLEFDSTENGTELPYCADVKIIKGYMSDGPGDDDVIDTRIDARGYNTCDETNPRRIERGLVIEFID